MAGPSGVPITFIPDIMDSIPVLEQQDCDATFPNSSGLSGAVSFVEFQVNTFWAGHHTF